MLDVPELLVGRLERPVVAEGGLVVDLGQVAELVLVAPEPQVVLGLGGGPDLVALDQVRIQRARLGDDLEDLLLEEAERVPALEQQDLQSTN